MEILKKKNPRQASKEFQPFLFSLLAMPSKKKGDQTEEQRAELSEKLKPASNIADWLAASSKSELLNFYAHFLCSMNLLLTILKDL